MMNFVTNHSSFSAWWRLAKSFALALDLFLTTQVTADAKKSFYLDN